MECQVTINNDSKIIHLPFEEIVDAWFMQCVFFLISHLKGRLIILFSQVMELANNMFTEFP